MWLDRLKYMKKQSGKTSKEISDETGVPKSTIDKLFSGQTKEPYLSSIKLIVHSLGYTLDDLDDTNIKAVRTITDDTDKQKLLNNYDKLNIIGKERLLTYSDDLVCSGNYSNTVTKKARTQDNNKKLILSTVAARSADNSTKIHTEYIEDLSQYTPDDTDL